MASIQDLLRDHQRAEEQEKIDAQRKAEEAERARVEAMQREAREAEQRVQAEEQARQAKIYEEQRKAAEIAAMHEATVQRAKMEAEAQARLAEMAARQEHEKHLHALQHDKSKKTLKWVAIGTGVVLFIALVGGGIALKSSHDKAVAAEAEATRLRDQITQAEQDKANIKAQLEKTQDPETIARLKAELAVADQKAADLNKALSSKGAAPRPGFGGAPAPGAGGGGGGGGGGAPAKPCKCMPGDPVCTCL